MTNSLMSTQLNKFPFYQQGLNTFSQNKNSNPLINNQQVQQQPNLLQQPATVDLVTKTEVKQPEIVNQEDSKNKIKTPLSSWPSDVLSPPNSTINTSSVQNNQNNADLAALNLRPEDLRKLTENIKQKSGIVLSQAQKILVISGVALLGVFALLHSKGQQVLQSQAGKNASNFVMKVLENTSNFVKKEWAVLKAGAEEITENLRPLVSLDKIEKYAKALSNADNVPFRDIVISENTLTSLVNKKSVSDLLSNIREVADSHSRNGLVPRISVFFDSFITKDAAKEIQSAINNSKPQEIFDLINKSAANIKKITMTMVNSDQSKLEANINNTTVIIKAITPIYENVKLDILSTIGKSLFYLKMF